MLFDILFFLLFVPSESYTLNIQTYIRKIKFLMLLLPASFIPPPGEQKSQNTLQLDLVAQNLAPNHFSRSWHMPFFTIHEIDISFSLSPSFELDQFPG